MNKNVSFVAVLQCNTQQRELKVKHCTFTEDFGLEFSQHLAVIQGLISNFPIMHVQRGNKNILIDIHGLIMHEDAFFKLLNVENPVPASEVSHDKEENGLLPVVYGLRRKPGRKPLYEKYHRLVEMVTNFIKQHSFSAHSRRRETSGTGSGVSLQAIRDHVVQELPELKDMSRSGIHYLMVPPSKGTHAASNYKGLVNVRIPKTGRNDYRENHENQHFLFARDAHREEFCSKFKSECTFFHVMTWLKSACGRPVTAVSRYHQERRFFMNDNAPNLADHDTPNPGYLLNCPGYQKLVENANKKEVIDQAYTTDKRNDFSGDTGFVIERGNEVSDIPADRRFFRDKLERLHHNRYMAGAAKLVIRPVKFTPSNVMHHANDILLLLKAEVEKRIGIVFLKVDNGGDWNLGNLVNQVYFCRLWRASKLDALGIVSYATRFSTYNIIEHLWAPMSKKLTSVILPSVLEGDDDVPYKLNLDNDEVKEKKVKCLIMQCV